MFALDLRVHKLVGDNTIVPTQALKDLFATADIRLSIKEIDQRIDNDPSDLLDYQTVARQILGQSSPIPGDPANLIIGRKWSGPGDTLANGILIDPIRRGFAAVFTWSSDLVDGGSSALLRSCAHEIGHMLNLSHGDGDKSIPTVECQSDIQDQFGQAFDSAWSKVGIRRPAGIDAFPFGNGERSWIASATIDEISPWGVGFKDSGLGAAQDLSAPDLQFNIKTDRNSFTLGTPIFFDLVLRNTGLDVASVPARIASGLGNVRFVLRHPSGKATSHAQAPGICGTGTRRLKSGEYSIYPQMFFPTDAHEPGKYLLQAASRISSKRIEPIELKLLPSRSNFDLFGSKSFANAMATNTLPNQRVVISKVDNFLAKTNRSPSPEAYHLAFLRARTTKSRKVQERLLRLAQHDRAPNSVRHAAYIYQASILCPQDALFERFAEQLREILEPHRDEHVREWLEVTARRRICSSAA